MEEEKGGMTMEMKKGEEKRVTVETHALGTVSHEKKRAHPHTLRPRGGGANSRGSILFFGKVCVDGVG